MPSAVTCVQVTLKYRFTASVAFLKLSTSEYMLTLDGVLEAHFNTFPVFPPGQTQLASPPLIFSLC